MINYPDGMAQLVDFEGFINENKTSFTDGDAIKEVDDEFICWVELKRITIPQTAGQSLLMERVINKDWKYGIAVNVEHSVFDTSKRVFLKDCMVKSYMKRNQKWTDVKHELTFFEFYNDVIKKEAIELGIDGSKL